MTKSKGFRPPDGFYWDHPREQYRNPDGLVFDTDTGETYDPQAIGRQCATVAENAAEQYLKARTDLKGRRITQDNVEGEIVAEQYYVFPGTTVTVCCLTLRNGMTCVGKAACADPENFRTDIGNKFAREDAVRHIAPYLAFRLKDEMKAQSS